MYLITTKWNRKQCSAHIKYKTINNMKKRILSAFMLFSFATFGFSLEVNEIANNVTSSTAPFAIEVRYNENENCYGKVTLTTYQKSLTYFYIYCLKIWSFRK